MIAGRESAGLAVCSIVVVFRDAQSHVTERVSIVLPDSVRNLTPNASVRRKSTYLFVVAGFIRPNSLSPGSSGCLLSEDSQASTGVAKCGDRETERHACGDCEAYGDDAFHCVGIRTR